MAVQAQRSVINPLRPTDPRNRAATQLPSIDSLGIDPRALFYLPFGGVVDAPPQILQAGFHPGSAASIAANATAPNFGLLHQPVVNATQPITAALGRKRHKDGNNSQSPPMLQTQLQPSALPVDLNQAQGCVVPPSGIVSTGLRLAIDDEHSTVTSSRPEARLASAHMPFLDEMYTKIMQQQEELRLLLKNQTEQLRQNLEEQTQRHSKAMLSILDEEANRQLRQKDLEIERVTKRNMELEERIRHLSLETCMWQNKAKNNEAIVAILRTNLQQSVVHSREPSKVEGCGDSEVDDAASAHIDENAGAQQARATLMMSKTGHEKSTARCCKRCMTKEASILLIPCLHLCLCNDCKGGVEKCPVCSAVATACVEVYLA